MAKKLIAIEITGTEDEALSVANAVWVTVGEHLEEGHAYVAVQGFDAPGWDEFDGEIRLSEARARRTK